MWEREFQILGEQLPDVRALDILCFWDFNNTNNLERLAVNDNQSNQICRGTYMNGTESGSMSSSHILIQ